MADVQRELEQLAAVGHCVVRDVIPPHRTAALREHVVRGRQAAQREYAATGGNLSWQRTADGGPGKNVVAYVPEFAAHLADERILAIARGALDPRVRIAQIEFTASTSSVPFRERCNCTAVRGAWSSWTHDSGTPTRTIHRPRIALPWWCATPPGG